MLIYAVDGHGRFGCRAAERDERARAGGWALDIIPILSFGRVADWIPWAARSAAWWAAARPMLDEH